MTTGSKSAVRCEGKAPHQSRVPLKRAPFANQRGRRLAVSLLGHRGAPRTSGNCCEDDPRNGPLQNVTSAAGLAIPAYFGRSEVTLENAAILLAKDLRAAQNRSAFMADVTPFLSAS